MGTRRYILGKVLQAVLTLAFVLVFNFFLFRVLPGDSAALLLRGTSAFNPQNLEALRADLGLDEPLPEQGPRELDQDDGRDREGKGPRPGWADAWSRTGRRGGHRPAS